MLFRSRVYHDITSWNEVPDHWWGAFAVWQGGLGVWGGAINWTIAGAALLTLLFIGSTIFTESITSAKYPAYRDYQRATSMLIPLPRRRRDVEATA